MRSEATSRRAIGRGAGVWRLLVVALACAQSDAPAPAPASETAAAPDPTCEAQQALESLDLRKPVPLLPLMAHHQKQNMRDHLLAVQEIVSAAAQSDFGAIERAVGRIGYSQTMHQMCTHMGAGAPGFTEDALAFHHTADKIAVASRASDLPGVMRALGETLETCTGCHETYRQSVVDEATWSLVTGGEQPAHAMQHGR